jgi:hypothetical protein
MALATRGWPADPTTDPADPLGADGSLGGLIAAITGGSKPPGTAPPTGPGNIGKGFAPVQMGAQPLDRPWTGGLPGPTDRGGGWGNPRPVSENPAATSTTPPGGGIDSAMQQLIQQITSGSNGGGGSTAPAAGTPSYLSQLFPNGLPQTNVATAGPAPQVNAPNVLQHIGDAASSLPKIENRDVHAPQISGLPTTAQAMGGIPTATAPRVGSSDVLSQLGKPSVTPQSVGTQSVLGAMGGSLDPGALTRAITAQMKPEFERENHALTESLANAGIVGGSTAGAVGDLSRQQQQTEAAALAPFEQTANAQRLQGATTDAGNALTGGIANQGADLNAKQFGTGLTYSTAAQDAARRLTAGQSNQATGADLSKFNVGTAVGSTQSDLQRLIQTIMANQQASMTGQQSNQSADLARTSGNASNAIGAGTSQADLIARILQGNQTATMGANQFDAASLNSGNQFDISNLIRGGMYDTGNYNSMQQYIMGLNNTDWLQQLGLQGQLATAGAGAQSAAYQPVFQQPAQTNFGGVAAGLAPVPTAQPNPTPPPNPGTSTAGKAA